MAKKKNLPIIISDIKTFRDFSNVQRIIDERFSGQMPVDIYRAFLKRITNPFMREVFIQKFRSIPPEIKCHKSDKVQQLKTRTNIKLSSEEMRENEIVIVSPLSFSYNVTERGPRLVYRSHMCTFFGEKEWFQYSILKSINRIFKIRINDYTGFSFIPYSDKQEFASILQQKYEELQNQIYKKELADCFSKIEKYIQNSIIIYRDSLRHFVMRTSIEDYSFDEGKQVYLLDINIIKYLNIKDKVIFHIPFQEIIKESEIDDYYEKYQDEIAEKWQDGFSRQIELTEIFPNLTCADISIVIQKICVERLNIDEPLDIIIKYAPENGKFSGEISRNSFIKLDCHQTDNVKAVFSDDVKVSLIEIMKNVKDKMLITFYTAFYSMYQEEDPIVQIMFDNRYKSICRPEDDYYDYRWKFDRYKSGSSSLLHFNKNNFSDWIWLTAQFRNGRFMEAYSFYDKDLTYSLEDTYTRPSVKVYLTVQMQGLPCTDSNKNYISKDNLMISMYALDTSKSIYRFIVETGKKYETLFFLWSYFGSNNYNKRQEFEYVLQWKELFGIHKFYKDQTLVYKNGIGFYDPRWPM